MSQGNTSKLQREVAYGKAFLAALNARLAAPTVDWPTTRCWTKPSLQQIFRQVRDELAAAELRSQQSNRSLIAWMSELGILHELKAQDLTIYILEFGGSAGRALESPELLMAACPQGVICYFSAVAFHSLTTQPVAHHHVAVLQKSTRASAPSSVDKAKSVPESRSRTLQLGKLLFRFAETPYYLAERAARLVPGVQQRAMGPRTNIRITTLEQTLLDTLYKPFHCGGPETVFEAWHEAFQLGGINEERLADYIERMNYPATARRTAVMFKLMQHAPGIALRRTLQVVREKIARNSEFAEISLLPGLDYSKTDEEWLVKIP